MVVVVILVIEKSFLHTAAFEHPLVYVHSGPPAAEKVLSGVYAVYKVLTRDVEIEFRGMVAFDSFSTHLHYHHHHHHHYYYYSSATLLHL